MSTPRFYLRQLELGPMQNFAYLIGDPATHQAAVIDPGWEVPKILQTAQRDAYQLVGAFVTHHHFDHVGGLDELLASIDVPVYAHREDAPLLRLARGTVKPMSGGETVQLGQLPLRLLHTPGHTRGSQCVLVEGHLFSGDTLFIRACGRWDLPGGDPAQLFESLVKKLKLLDDATILCPGHHYAPEVTSTMGEEKRTNPFLQPATVQEFLHLAGVA